jgi:oligoribonuclease NrnB/cAMP/cGMP phosphodiesterase (DHH superfamily)
MAMNILCIYHGNCADGFGAAWVVRKFFASNPHDKVDFHPGVYQEPPPDVTGRDVLMVDFSYKRPVIEQMAKSARSVIILDHHKTAEADLSGFNTATPPDIWAAISGPWVPAPGVHVLFDMNRSGAGLTWDYLFPNQPRPWLIEHIEDRDLWRFKYPTTRAIQAAVFSYPYDFEVWDGLAARCQHEAELLALEGIAIERKHFKDIDEALKVMQRRAHIADYYVPVASLPYFFSSDAGHKMAQGEAFAACYWDTPTGRVFSLRSADDGIDVSEIAKKYGGGGHARAAGFTVPHDHQLATDLQ